MTPAEKVEVVADLRARARACDARGAPGCAKKWREAASVLESLWAPSATEDEWTDQAGRGNEYYRGGVFARAHKEGFDGE